MFYFLLANDVYFYIIINNVYFCFLNIPKTPFKSNTPQSYYFFFEHARKKIIFLHFHALQSIIIQTLSNHTPNIIKPHPKHYQTTPQT